MFICSGSSDAHLNVNSKLTTSGNNNVYKIRKFVVPTTSKKMQIYKTPSKTAPRLIWCQGEEPYDDWRSSGKVDYFNVLPVIDETKDWYKVYCVYYDDPFLWTYCFGYVPKSESKEAVLSQASWKDVKDYWNKVYYNQDLGFYFKSGTELRVGKGHVLSGSRFVIGKIENGIAMESEHIFSRKKENNTKVAIEYLKNRQTGELGYYLMDKNEDGSPFPNFSKLSSKDIEKLLSLNNNTHLSIIGVKVKGIEHLYWTRIGNMMFDNNVIELALETHNSYEHLETKGIGNIVNRQQAKTQNWAIKGKTAAVSKNVNKEETSMVTELYEPITKEEMGTEEHFKKVDAYWDKIEKDRSDQKVIIETAHEDSNADYVTKRQKDIDIASHKYGKKYVDAMLNNKILIGTPEGLIVGYTKSQLIEETRNKKTYKIINNFGYRMATVAVDVNTKKVIAVRY